MLEPGSRDQLFICLSGIQYPVYSILAQPISMSAEDPTNPMKPDGAADTTNWIRLRLRKNKVWVEATADGLPLQKGGRVRIKYQLNQDQDYRVRADNLRPLEEPPTALPEPPGKPASTPTPAAHGRTASGVVHVYTDGASSGNPGPSGIGVVLTYGSRRKEISEYIGEATNNIAELMAIQKGLSAVKNKRLPVRVYTDSTYAHGVLALNWKPKKNQDLIAAIRRSMAGFARLKLVKVPGHQGIAENERADELATSAVRNAGGT
jgi:ribonuclease HI